MNDEEEKKKPPNSTPRTRDARKRKDDLAELGIIYAGWFKKIKKTIPKSVRKTILPFLKESHMETLEYYDDKINKVAGETEIYV